QHAGGYPGARPTPARRNARLGLPEKNAHVAASTPTRSGVPSACTAAKGSRGPTKGWVPLPLIIHAGGSSAGGGAAVVDLDFRFRVCQPSAQIFSSRLPAAEAQPGGAIPSVAVRLAVKWRSEREEKPAVVSDWIRYVMPPVRCHELGDQLFDCGADAQRGRAANTDRFPPDGDGTR